MPFKLKRKQLLISVAIGSLLISVGVIIAVLGQLKTRQEIRKKASEEPDQYVVTKSIDPTGIVCGQEANLTIRAARVGGNVALPIPVDLVLVIDHSGSMDDLGGNPPQPISNAKNAANLLVEMLSFAADNTSDRVAVVGFGDTAELSLPLSDQKETIKQAVNNIAIQGYTNLSEGILAARNELQQNARDNSRKIIVVLADGLPNRSHEGLRCESWPTSANQCSQDALNQANEARNQNMIVYTVGLDFDGIEQLHPGSGEFGRELLKQLADSLGHFFEAPDHEQLATIYQEIGLNVQDIVTSTTLIEIVNQNLEIISGSITPEPDSVTDNTIVWSWDTLTVGEELNFQVKVTCNQEPGVFNVNSSQANLTYVEYDGASREISLPTDILLTVNSGGTCPEPTATPTTVQLGGQATPTPTEAPAQDGYVAPTNTPTPNPTPTSIPDPTDTPAPTPTEPPAQGGYAVPTATPTPTTSQLPARNATPNVAGGGGQATPTPTSPPAQGSYVAPTATPTSIPPASQEALPITGFTLPTLLIAALGLVLLLGGWLF